MQSTVSVRGQTVIPKEVRAALGIKPGDKVAWILGDKGASFYVIPEDPVAAMRGILKQSGFTFEKFMKSRNEERRRERLHDEQEEQRWRATSSTRRP
ncbi:MAG TPA: AbrB/MazE/SpoVT family DNA-binding domain-containing protein [Dehalococcoidia bacterium]|jgi:AbrB family looped-hinge helix DNA binding protein